LDRTAEFGNRRVLVIDDNAAIHADFRKILGPQEGENAELAAAARAIFGDSGGPSTPPDPGFEIESAMQGKEGVKRVADALTSGHPYALAFVDMRMPPGWDGLETIEKLWAVDPHVQVVICSAYSDYDWPELVARLGHADNLLVVKKPFEPVEIQQCANALTRKWQNERALKHQLETLENIVSTRTQGLEAANKQLRHLATHDALTGLPNRALLDDRISQAIAGSQRDQHRFAAIMIDLDRFKPINDTLGHGAGDELLREVARRLCSVVRPADTVVRIGGDEFMLIINPIGARQEAEQIAQRAIDALKPEFKIAGVEVHATLSVGVAFYPDDGTTVETLIARADAAMYCAKQRGRNNWQCFEPGMDRQTREKMLLESDLHLALQNNQFELYYQPKVDLGTAEVHSAEALIRWNHPERGQLVPSDFLAIAEECGLITEIGQWVVREACHQAKSWQKQGLAPIRVTVNLSPLQFRSGRLLQIIREVLKDEQLDPHCLEVEISESSVMSNPEESVRILEQLSEIGVLVSVDNFGTGYSSMSYLRRFPIDKLKIDRSFIDQVMTRADDASIVRAIVSLAHSLGLKVGAEGVETAEQLEFLKRIGCDQYQGYQFSTPVNAKTFKELLSKQRKKS